LASLGHPGKFQQVSRLGLVTVRHSSRGRQSNFAALNRGRHLYLAGRPSRWALAHISSFNWFRVLPSLLQQRSSTEVTVNQTLHDVSPSPGLVYYIYIFGGFCPLMEFCPVPNSLYIQVLCSPVFAELLPSTPAVGSSQTLRRGTRNGITEFSQRAPPIFGRGAITLGIAPHSSIVFISVHTF